MLPFSTKADMFHHAFFKPCHIFLNAAIPFLFHHAFSKHFIMLFPNPAVFFWILPFQASFTMLFLHISPWFILRCHFSLKPLWKTPPMTLFGNHFWSASPPLSPIIQGLGYTREQLNFLHNPVIYETNWQSPTSSTRGETSGVLQKMLKMSFLL